MTTASTIDLLSSSFTAGPASGFHGYCFKGFDYIFGQEGALKYSATTGNSIGPGEDGCYVCIRRAGESFEFGTDAAGIAKLFYYDQDGVWAVASSFSRLVDHLRSNGVRLAPNLPQLHALSWGITFTTQLSSYETIFHGIRLLPSTHILTLTPQGLIVRPRTDAATSTTYADALRHFLRTWTSRFATLFSDERIQVTIDLTGGVDSRAIFALAKTALSSSGLPPSRASFRSASTPRWQRDLDIAKNLANKYGTTLNAPPRENRASLDSLTAYDRWRAVNLGVYLPIYLHRSSVDPFDIHVNGGGGENHRHFYPAMDAAEFLRHQSRRSPAHLFNEWRRDVEAAIADLSAQNRPNEALILHYREFRNRFHTGRPPHYRTGFAPLTTTTFHQVANHGRPTDSGQLNYDIMENLIPGLKDLPYDEPNKSPSESNRRNLTIVDLDSEVALGKTYLGDYSAEPRGANPNAAKNGLTRLSEALSRAVAGRAVASFLDEGTLSNARRIVDAAVSDGHFEHATTARSVSIVLAAELAFAEQ